MAKDDSQPLDFLFDPMRFLNDEQVRTMRPAELGGYVALFCNGWTQPEPGVLEDDDRLLGLLARCTPDEWAAMRPRIARCYDLTSRPGFWVQRGTVASASARRARIEAARAAGAEGARSRWGAHATKPPADQSARALVSGRTDPNQTELMAAPSGKPMATPMPVRLGVVGSGTEQQQPNPNPDVQISGQSGGSGRSESGQSNGSDDSFGWITDGFEAFWAAWPVGYKVGRLDALAIWQKIRPRTAAMAERIMAGLERAKVSERWARVSPEGVAGYLIPNPKTWLRQGRWDDDLAPATRSDGMEWARKLEAGSGECST